MYITFSGCLYTLLEKCYSLKAHYRLDKVTKYKNHNDEQKSSTNLLTID